VRVSTRGLIILLALSATATAAACTRAATAPSPLTVSVLASSTARSADIKLDMPGGDLKVTGAGVDLVSGTLAYARPDAKPEVSSGTRESTAGVVQTAVLKQPGGASVTLEAIGAWKLQLGGGLPTDLSVPKGTGDLDLDLALVDAKNLSVGAGTGRLSVELGGPHPGLSHVSLANASGETTIDASGEYPALEAFEVRSASGAVDLDISGTWGKSFTGSVVTQSGAIRLVLPSKVNVRVVVSDSSGKVTAQGLTQEGTTWSYRSPSPSPYTLTLNVTSAGGDVDLSVKK